MACEKTSFDGPIAMNLESHQRFSSPPPKPPRRRHSDQSSKISGAAVQKKGVNSNGSKYCSKVTRHNDNIHGSESLPADWVPASHENPGTSIVVNKNDNHSLSNYSHDCECNSPITDPENFTSGSTEHFWLDSSLLSVSSSSTWPIDCVKMCVSSSTKSASCTDNDKNFMCFNSGKSKCNPEVLLHRHHSDPFLSKSTQTFCKSNSFSNVGLEGSNLDFLSKEFKCPHSFRENLSVSEEARALKERNDKLWKHMCMLQKKIDNEDPLNESISFSDLMYDLYQTQKDKDIALEKRIKVVSEERNAAVQELEDVLKSITEQSEDNDYNEEAEQQELKQLFKEIDAAQSPVKLLQQQRILLSCLYHAKETKLNRVSHQLKIVLEEKEQALEKAAKLEEELVRWKSSRCLLHSEAKQWEAGLVEALCQTISQRDSALAKAQCFQEQIKSLKVQLSSYQSKNHLFDEYHSPVASPKIEKTAPITHGLNVKSQEDSRNVKVFSLNHSDTDSDQVRFLKCRVAYLNHQLDSEIKRRQAAEDSCHKLERIINIMRKTMNGSNVGVSV